MLDFKKEISSVHRIAKSIVAFANHHGGTLLIGVNDNGTISGVRAEEEKFMLEESSKKFCNPPVDLVIHEWNIMGKIVLEVIVPIGLVTGFFLFTIPYVLSDLAFPYCLCSLKSPSISFLS